MSHPNITFIGAGNMASSLIHGLLAGGQPANQLTAADPYPPSLEKLATLGVTTTADNQTAIAQADVVVLAVKPQVMAEVLKPLKFNNQQVIISIAAGVPLGAISQLTSADQPLIRCMPNTPALVQSGITGLFANDAASAKQRQLAETVLNAAGQTLWVETEADLDAVTAVSGSGPAYFFYLMESMIKAGEALGLDRKTATQLTLATATGAAKMAELGTEAPATLRANVTSPGGTTERALSIMDEHNTQETLIEALRGAAQRASELADELAKDFTAR